MILLAGICACTSNQITPYNTYKTFNTTIENPHYSTAVEILSHQNRNYIVSDRKVIILGASASKKNHCSSRQYQSNLNTDITDSFPKSRFLTQPPRVNIINRIPINISIQIHTPSQPNRISHQIPTCSSYNGIRFQSQISALGTKNN